MFLLMTNVREFKNGFASDNCATIHPEILNAIVAANNGHVVGYGDDSITAATIKAFEKQFGKNIGVYFMLTGTGANVLGLSAILKPHQAIICADHAHINVDECGAPEKFTGSKLYIVPTSDGKITVEGVAQYLVNVGDVHRSQPRVISITQPTEYGTLYSLEEIKKLAKFAHSNNMLLHMDGARIANAAAALNVSLKKITVDVGVDVLSFGGTKNGLMLGEAVIFFGNVRCDDFPFIRKQGMQLASKMRFISCQFEALLTHDLWLKNATHANHMAQLLAEEVSKIPGVKLTQKVETNAVFAIIPKQIVSVLQKQYFFYVWNPVSSEVRWVTSFDTKEQDVQEFVKLLRTALTK